MIETENKIGNNPLVETKTPWGEIGYLVYKRTYSRRLNENNAESLTEEFPDTIERVIDACRTQLKVGFTEQEEAELSDILLGLKGIVAGRFLWQLGTKTVKKLGLLSLQNCSFVTINEPVEPFTWAMDCLMLGSGVGFNIQKENVYQLPKVKSKIKIERVDTADADFIVPDSREGWVKLLGKVLKAHFHSGEGFTYSTMLIRGKGAPIKGFGGTASGPEDLCIGIQNIHKILNQMSNKKLRPIDCLDIMNIIGEIVVAGNVRRSAQIALGDPDDIDFLRAKRWDLGSIPNWRKNSNNSVVCSSTSQLPREFWKTYEQGEPYGIINMELSKKIGRLGETEYPDPDVEGYNPSLRKGTRVYTTEGLIPIEELEGKRFITRNLRGELAEASCWLSGKNKKLIKVTLENGKKYFCTPEHKWAIHTPQGYVKCETPDLKPGHLLPIIRKDSLDYGNLGSKEDGFLLGWLYGDGSFTVREDGRKQIFIIVSEKDQEYNIHERLLDKLEEICDHRYSFYKRGNNLELSVSNEKLTKYLDEFKVGKKENGLPKCIWSSASEDFRRGFIDGLFSADATIDTSYKSSSLSISQSNEKLANDISELLGFYGIKHSFYHGVYKSSFPNRKDYGDKDYNRHTIKISHRASIEHFQKCFSFSHINKQEKLSSISKLSGRKGLYSNHYAVKSIEWTDIEEDVWDIHVDDDTHCFQIAYSITGNCAEQSLCNKETCALAEIFLPNLRSKEDFHKTIYYLYRIVKHSLALPCHHKDTQNIVNSNMRMGIGITGTLQASEEQRSWLDEGYKYLRKLDKEYSESKGWPESIKLTTSKPSGTLSLLAGTTPGIHPSPAGPYYIRRVRIEAGSPLLEVCRKHGYGIEYQRKFDGTEDKATFIVSFPCKVPEGTPIAEDFTATKQLEWVRWMQKNWSDNAVSCTVYYRKNEIPIIKKWLDENLTEGIKTVSFLLYHGHGFDQAPYETITKEQYDALKEGTSRINAVEVKEKDFEIDDCASGACPIK